MKCSNYYVSVNSKPTEMISILQFEFIMINIMYFLCTCWSTDFSNVECRLIFTFLLSLTFWYLSFKELTISSTFEMAHINKQPKPESYFGLWWLAILYIIADSLKYEISMTYLLNVSVECWAGWCLLHTHYLLLWLLNLELLRLKVEM